MQNNFYLNVPAALDDKLVKWAGKKFEHFYVKCGEAILETVEARTNKEGANTRGLKTLFQFYLPIDKINTAYNDNRSSHFDTLIFGHQNLKTNFKNTVFNYFRSKKIDCLPKNSATKYGYEYIDIADDFNLWLKDNPEEVANINAHPDEVMIYNVATRYLTEVMPMYLAEFAEKKLNFKVVKQPFSFRDYQVPVYKQICKLISEDKIRITAELPPRWGKTKTTLKLFADCNEAKLLVVASYVKTVNTSYKNAVYTTDFGEELQFVDLTDKTEFKHLNPALKTVVAVNTTGSLKATEARAAKLKSLKTFLKVSGKPEQIMYLNEEADFGNHTDMSKLKLDKYEINKRSVVLSVTGTDAYKVDKVFDDANHIVVNLNDWNEIHFTGVNSKVRSL